MTDVRIECHGSVVLFRPYTVPASAWLHRHTDGYWFGPALMVEPRYTIPLADGLVDAGFMVEVAA